MPDSLRPATASRPEDGESAHDATIEQLLVTGLDHYISGRYESAIHIWTRVLFLDRGHSRAKAYIERARAALAERHRESDELLQGGMTAFNEGAAGRARDLLTTVVARGGPEDVALSLLDRIDRLSTTAPEVARVLERRPMPARSVIANTHEAERPEPDVHWPQVFLAAVAVVLLLVAIYTVVERDQLQAWLGLTTSETAPVLPAAEDPLPVLHMSDLLVSRARGLYARGHVHEALRLLDGVRADDPSKHEADQLRAELQRALLDARDAGEAGETGDREPPPEP